MTLGRLVRMIDVPTPKLQNVYGILLVNLLVLSFTVQRSRRPISDGMLPEYELVSSPMTRNDFKLPISVGTVPPSLRLLPRSKAVKAVMPPIAGGKVPVSALFARSKYCRLVSRPSCEGMEEIKLSVPRVKRVRLSRLPRVVGIVAEPSATDNS